MIYKIAKKNPFSEKFVKNEGRNWSWFLTTRHGCEDIPLSGFRPLKKTKRILTKITNSGKTIKYYKNIIKLLERLERDPGRGRLGPFGGGPLDFTRAWSGVEAPESTLLRLL